MPCVFASADIIGLVQAVKIAELRHGAKILGQDVWQDVLPCDELPQSSLKDGKLLTFRICMGNTQPLMRHEYAEEALLADCVESGSARFGSIERQGGHPKHAKRVVFGFFAKQSAPDADTANHWQTAARGMAVRRTEGSRQPSPPTWAHCIRGPAGTARPSQTHRSETD